jgi:hypothetical protein
VGKNMDVGIRIISIQILLFSFALFEAQVKNHRIALGMCTLDEGNSFLEEKKKKKMRMDPCYTYTVTHHTGRA